MKNKKIPLRALFFIGAVIIYFGIYFLNNEIFFKSLKFFLNSITKIIPALLFVFILMTLLNYFIPPQKVLDFSRKKGIKKWILMSFAGVFSTGPPFLWFPILRDLKKQGLTNGLITTYLYNRAVVISFIPLLIYYFSLKYTIALYIAITASALIQGLIINKFFKE